LTFTKKRGVIDAKRLGSTVGGSASWSLVSREEVASIIVVPLHRQQEPKSNVLSGPLLAVLAPALYVFPYNTESITVILGT
jgi:hypothetical protein